MFTNIQNLYIYILGGVYVWCLWIVERIIALIINSHILIIFNNVTNFHET